LVPVFILFSSVEAIATADSNKKRKISFEPSTMATVAPLDMNVNDISNEIQESVNQVLSFSKMNSSHDLMIMDTSFSSLSSGHDFISDYQSTSGSEANISRLSHSSQNSLSLSKEEDEPEREERKIDEVITELEENSSVPTEQHEQQQGQPVESISEEVPPVCASLRSFSTDSTIPEDGEDNEIIVNNNLINKRRKLCDNRRKSISVLKRVNNNIHPEMMMNSSERETVVSEQSTVVANEDIFVDDIMLTLEPPKISEEPDMQPNNPKKRRASNLPVPTLSIQTRAMRRQSLSAIATSLDQITSNLPATPTLTSLSMPVINEIQKENKSSNNNHKVTVNQEPITVSGIASSSNTNDENTVVREEKKTPANKRGKIPLAPSNQQNISTPAITVDLMNKPKGSSNGKKTATKNSSPFNNSSNKENDESIDLFADINIDWLSGGDQQLQPSVKKNTTKNHIKPTAKKYQEIQNAIDFTNIQVVDENNPNNTHVHPPSPTRKETRRMSISNRRTSLAKVNAMLDSVTSLLVEPVTSSVSSVSASAARLTTRSMR
jgi:hypothetical protein